MPNGWSLTESIPSVEDSEISTALEMRYWHWNSWTGTIHEKPLEKKFLGSRKVKLAELIRIKKDIAAFEADIALLKVELYDDQ
jgi:hypothetical protein